MSDSETFLGCSIRTKNGANAARCHRELSILGEAGTTKVLQLRKQAQTRSADLARLLAKSCRKLESRVPHGASGIGDLDHNPVHVSPRFSPGKQRCDL